MSVPLLAAASERLRGKPGRPRKIATAPTPAIPPRLVDVAGAARYLGISTWSVRDLEAAGVLPRVRVPLPRGGELRRLLFDREDLDRLISTWKDPA